MRKPFAFISFALASPALAQPPVVLAPEVVVTASRLPEDPARVLAGTSVVDDQTIRDRQPANMAELLDGLAGVQASFSGGSGKLTSVFTRGTESDHTLVLIDGIPAGSNTAGGFAWEFLPPEQIDHIEVVRGPRSSLYGSDAIGGVVQLFTRRGASKAEFHGGAGVGENAEQRFNLGASGPLGRGWYRLDGAYRSTDGIDARSPTLEFGFSPLDEPDRDGYRNASLAAAVGQPLGETLEWELSLLHAQGRTEFDSSANNVEDYRQQTISSTLRWQVREDWDSRLRLGHSLDDREDFRRDGTLARDRFESTKTLISWQNDFYLFEEDILTVGLDWQEDGVDGSVDYKVDERFDRSLFGQYQLRRGDHEWVAGLRVGENEQFGGHTTGNLSWGWRFAPRLRLIAAYGTAFKAPTFNDLYFPDFFGFATSNPNLDPEKSRTAELALEARHAPYGTVRASVYRTDVDDLIALDENFIPQNLNRARIEGLELSGTGQWQAWHWAAMASYQDPRDRDTGRLLRRRAQLSAKVDLHYRQGDLALGGSLLGFGRRFDDPANRVRLGGFARLDLNARYALDRRWTIRLTLDNVFDKDYETVESYNEPGRTAMLSIAYQSE
ncbi:MAG: TonB-dependent receptor [Chromatiales bacterium]|nr:TonB-dependent receptor [Chromatiales bacterium]